MKLITDVWDFKTKNTVGVSYFIVYKARRCINGNKQVPSLDFHPMKLYDFVVRYEIIEMFIAKGSAENLIIEGADVPNA